MQVVKSCLFPFYGKYNEIICFMLLLWRITDEITEVTGGNFKETNKMTYRVSLMVKTMRQAKHVTVKKKIKRKEYINDKIFIGLEILSSKWVKTKKNNKVRWSTFSCWLHWRIQYYPNCGILLMCLLLVQKPVSIQKSLTRNSKIFLLLNYWITSFLVLF